MIPRFDAIAGIVLFGLLVLALVSFVIGLALGPRIDDGEHE